MLEISWWILLHNWADKLRLMVRIIKKFLKSPQHYTMQKKVLNIISTILVMLTSLVCGLNISSCKKKKKNIYRTCEEENGSLTHQSKCPLSCILLVLSKTNHREQGLFYRRINAKFCSHS